MRLQKLKLSFIRFTDSSSVIILFCDPRCRIYHSCKAPFHPFAFHPSTRQTIHPTHDSSPWRPHLLLLPSLTVPPFQRRLTVYLRHFGKALPSPYPSASSSCASFARIFYPMSLIYKNVSIPTCAALRYRLRTPLYSFC